MTSIEYNNAENQSTTFLPIHLSVIAMRCINTSSHNNASTTQLSCPIKEIIHKFLTTPLCYIRA
eukprot:m.34242 g.34242  ORF g.34242 m.34242 type:complete len:64 (-) comp6507_c0_seq2:318-509(-)